MRRRVQLYADEMLYTRGSGGDCCAIFEKIAFQRCLGAERMQSVPRWHMRVPYILIAPLDFLSDAPNRDPIILLFDHMLRGGFPPPFAS